MPIQRQMRVVNSESADDADSADAARPAIRVAFATSNLSDVDEHFGSATRMALFDVDAEESRLAGVVEFSETRQDGNENKLLAKFEALEGCHAVISLAVGSSAVRQLASQGIQPVKLTESTPIAAALEHLQGEVRSCESSWVRRALERSAQNAEERIGSMLDEGWDE